MIFISKNKGFLVVIYLFLFAIIITWAFGFLDRNIGGLFSKFNTNLMNSGFIFSCSGLCCIISDKYSIDNMKIVKDEFQINEFFYFKLGLWGYGLLYFGILNIIGGLFE